MSEDMNFTPEEIKLKSKFLQQKLIDEGWTIDVSHNRIMNGFSAINETETGYETDNCLNRYEFREAVESGLWQAYDGYVHAVAPTFGMFVWPTGGFTRVTLTNDNISVSGKYNFSPNEPFFKAVGIVRAIGKALRSLKKGYVNEDNFEFSNEILSECY